MAQACYPFFLAGSWGVVEVILFFCFLGYPLNPAYLVFGCVVAGVAGVLVQRPSDIVFWNCWGRDVAHWPSPHSSCAPTLERSLVLLFRFLFWKGRLVKSRRSSCASGDFAVLVERDSRYIYIYIL